MNKEINNQEFDKIDEQKDKAEEFAVSGHYDYGFGMNLTKDFSLC